MPESLMHLHFLLLIFLSCVSSSSFATTNFDSPVDGFVACRPHQIQAFTEFKSEFDTRQCNHRPFNGVWCDNLTGAITMLRLKACLSGTLKPNSSLFRLHHLRHLDLSQNSFISSSLPYQFGNLNILEVLSLSANGFIGQVPSSFSNLSLLTMLDLSQNDFIGTFPLVQNLTKLSFLNLSNNHFSGTLNPNSSLFDLNQLRYLNLDYNNFISSLPLEFGNLKRLEFLSLSTNGFLGKVPPTISNLTRLTMLHLDHNKLTGSLTLVQNLTKLYELDLSYNSFCGTIPSLLTFTSLSYLDVRGNHLTGSIVFPNSSFLESVLLGDNYFDGKILELISNLINLKELHLSFLNISYPIDLTLFSSLKSLSHLALSGNNISPSSLSSHSDIPPNLEMLFLSGCGIREFPNILKILHKLNIIDLSNNLIKGKVPVWLWNLPRLSVVTITNNSFDGFEGPKEFRLTSTVKLLFLNQNCFEGEVPILPLSINILSAWDNRFTGSIPLSICDYKSLTDLTLAYNNLTGPVPQCLCNLTHVDLRNNNLEGNIPDEFYAGAPLQSLDVGYNQLTGKLPRSLLNCSFLQFLSVDNNKIEDTFPFGFKALPELQVLTLGSNRFYGPISPPDQGPLGFPELRILEISDNEFTGSLLPSYFVNWKATSLTMNEDRSLYMEYNTDGYVIRAYTYKDFIDLKYKGQSMKQANIFTSYASVDFSGNKLEGQIPESIGLLKALIALNLSNNAFTGHIPLSLANVSELESLDLSRNHLSGTIPSGLGSLSFLAYINVSNNQLKGVIPQGAQITGQPKSSFEGNAMLCGLPLRETCLGSDAPSAKQPKKEEEEEEEEVVNWKGVAMGYGPGVLLGLAIGQVIASYKPEWLVKDNWF